MPTAREEPPRNAFERDKPGTAARSNAEDAIEALRLKGGIFVEAVRATRMPMAVTDPTLPGNPIVFANSSFLKLSGYRMEEVLGQQPYFLNGPDTDPHDAARFEEALRGDQDDIVETFQYRRDGSRFLASVLLSAFKDESGKTVHHFLSWLDVTRRHDAESRVSLLQQAQAALRQSEDRVRDVLNSMLEGFALFDPDFTIVDVNEATLQLDGRAREEIVGRSHWDAFPGSEDSPVGELFKRVMHDREPGSLEHVYRWPDGREMWIEVRAYPNPNGRVACFWRDITEQKLAAEALRESEERFAQFARSTTDVLWIRDADTMTLEYISPAFESVFGFAKGAVEGELEPGAALVDPADRDRVMEHLDAVRRGEPQIYEFRIVHGSDGGARWIRDYCFPLLDETGGVQRIGGIARDVTELKFAEDARRESESRLAAAFESVPAGVALIATDGQVVLENAEYRRFLPDGIIPPRDPSGPSRWQGWDDKGNKLKPTDFPTARALRGERVTPGQEMLFTDDDGRSTWTIVATAPTYDAHGKVNGAVSTISDIDGRKRSEQALREKERHTQLLLAELQHRVRNTLAMVRSIAQRTAENSQSADEMLAHFQGRLDAFSRVQAALTRNADGKVDLQSLIDDELLAHATREGKQIKITGPQVMIEARTAERMSLAIHELVTNAVKHGALSAPDGRIRVEWQITESPDGERLSFGWTESGVKVERREDQREGFGMELLLRSLPYDLQATTQLKLDGEGLRFELDMPLKRGS